MRYPQDIVYSNWHEGNRQRHVQMYDSNTGTTVTIEKEFKTHSISGNKLEEGTIKTFIRVGAELSRAVKQDKTSKVTLKKKKLKELLKLSKWKN